MAALSTLWSWWSAGTETQTVVMFAVDGCNCALHLDVRQNLKNSPQFLTERKCRKSLRFAGLFSIQWESAKGNYSGWMWSRFATAGQFFIMHVWHIRLIWSKSLMGSTFMLKDIGCILHNMYRNSECKCNPECCVLCLICIFYYNNYFVVVVVVLLILSWTPHTHTPPGKICWNSASISNEANGSVAWRKGHLQLGLGHSLLPHLHWSATWTSLKSFTSSSLQTCRPSAMNLVNLLLPEFSDF